MKLKVNTSKPYNVEIDYGLVTKIGLPEGLVVTDTNIYNYHTLTPLEKTYVIEAGERSKVLANCERIAEKLSRTGEQSLVAFGGGVVGDLTGFVASTYKGGIPLIQVPTSLMAMVDSSVGGKTGVNLGDLKNYFRTIDQPKSVLIDPYFLQSLLLKEFRNGLAEVIKYAYLFGKPDLERLDKGVYQGDTDLLEIISQCCKLKAEVVEKDEMDNDHRHVLNFGHTIGHAIELTSGLSHGEAVSIGMKKELEIAIKLGLASEEKLEKLENTLLANHLPIYLPDYFNLEETVELMKHDKKGEFVFAFDEENYCVKVKEKIIREVLK